MKPFVKGVLIYLSLVIGFLVLCFFIVFLLSEVFNDNNTPWLFIPIVWIGTPLLGIVTMIYGGIKFFKDKSEFGKGLLLGPIFLIVPILIPILLIYSITSKNSDYTS